jgi:WD40 repeat protein
MSNEVLDLDILAEVLFEQGLDALIEDLEGEASTSHVLDVLRSRRDILLERPWELALQVMAGLGHLAAFGPELAIARKQTPMSLRHGFIQGGEPEPIHVMHEHSNFVGGLAFTPNGTEFYSSSEDGTVRRWVVGQAESAEVIKEGSPVNRLRVDLEGENLLLAGDDHTIEIWSWTAATA